MHDQGIPASLNTLIQDRQLILGNCPGMMIHISQCFFVGVIFCEAEIPSPGHIADPGSLLSLELIRGRNRTDFPDERYFAF